MTKMEQILVLLLVETSAIGEMVEASNEKMKFRLRRLEAWLEKTEAKGRACQKPRDV
jgi:hypothetical protein